MQLTTQQVTMLELQTISGDGQLRFEQIEHVLVHSQKMWKIPVKTEELDISWIPNVIQEEIEVDGFKMREKNGLAVIRIRAPVVEKCLNTEGIDVDEEVGEGLGGEIKRLGENDIKKLHLLWNHAGSSKLSRG